MASIYSKSAPRRLAGPRRTLRQRQAGLRGPVEVFASVKRACMALSNTSPASSRLAWPRRSLRQRQAGLHGPVEVFASVKQACMALSKSSLASNGLAWPCRTLRQRQAGLQDLVEVFASVKRGWLSYPAGRLEGGQSWGQEGGLCAGIYLCPRFKPKKKQIYEQFDLPIPESGK